MNFLLNIEEDKYFKMDYALDGLFMNLYSNCGNISLTARNYQKLKSLIPVLDILLLNVSKYTICSYYHLGNDVYVYIVSPYSYVNLCKFNYKPTDNKLYPTIHGTSLEKAQWSLFCKHLDVMEANYPLFCFELSCKHVTHDEIFMCKQCTSRGSMMFFPIFKKKNLYIFCCKNTISPI